jgi:hypothetical protein
VKFQELHHWLIPILSVYLKIKSGAYQLFGGKSLVRYKPTSFGRYGMKRFKNYISTPNAIIINKFITSTVILVCLTLLIGCWHTRNVKSAIVYGESTISLSHAAAQVNVAMNSAKAYGYRPISVGGGVGVGFGEGVAKLYTVLAILEGPDTAPDLAPGSGAPLNVDSDRDGIPDGVENAHGLDPNNASDASGDLDQDLFTNLQEHQAGTNMFDPDTDGDHFKDGQDRRPLNPMVH